jgi:putative transposase
MARPVRIEFPGATYHVMSHGVAGAETFIDDIDRNQFLRILQGLVDQGKFLLHAFALMNNHFHLLCETPNAGLGRHIQFLLGRYSQWFNRRWKRKGHLWQDRYKALLVEDGDYFLDCSRYIHLNPVKAGICQRPDEYSWSSYLAFLGAGREPSLVSTLKTLSCFPTSLEYADFVCQNGIEKLRNPFECAIGGAVFGSSEFAARLGVLSSHTDMIDIPGAFAWKQADLSETDQINEAINDVFPSISKCQRTRLMVFSLRRFTDKSNAEIAAVVGRCPSAVTHIWKGFQIRLVTDTQLQNRLSLLSDAISRRFNSSTLRP